MTDGPSAPWRVERARGTTAELLAPWPPPAQADVAAVRAARLHGRPAVVLGSTQAPSVVDADRASAAGLEVQRRPTGGGAVLVAPDAQVWLDVWVPRGHVLWENDIIAAASWLGQAWRAALGRLGLPALRAHAGPATRTVWSDLICFAGVGPGELCVVDSGAKVTGLAQRRSRAGARFHVTAPLVWDPSLLPSLLDASVLPAPDGGGPGVLDGAAVGLRRLSPVWSGATADGDVIGAVEDAVISALP